MQQQGSMEYHVGREPGSHSLQSAEFAKLRAHSATTQVCSHMSQSDGQGVVSLSLGLKYAVRVVVV